MEIYKILFEPYQQYTVLQVIIEIFAAGFGIVSVVMIGKRNILGYPTGILSTATYSVLLFQWGLMGDMMINVYYTAMSMYGWILWSKNLKDKQEIFIQKVQRKDFFVMSIIFIFSFLFTMLIYFLKPIFQQSFSKESFQMLSWSFSWVDYMDCFTTAVFLIAMWLMAKRKIENWSFWIVGNIVSIPLYIIKGYAITSFQYLIFLILAIYGRNLWIKAITKYQSKS